MHAHLKSGRPMRFRNGRWVSPLIHNMRKFKSKIGADREVVIAFMNAVHTL